MPLCLRPTAPIAAAAILVGDPGRALLLAQELLEQPKMSNHARGLWGYHGIDRTGRELTIQSTGIGGPSAALVLSDLVELGVSRAVRIGTCLAVDPTLCPGGALAVEGAIAVGGSAAAFGIGPGTTVRPEAGLTDGLAQGLGDDGRRATIASVDAHPGAATAPPGALALDMQTAPLLARARMLEIPVAVALIVTERRDGAASLEKEELEKRERLLGGVASALLSA